MCSALTYHVEFRVTSVRALAWGPFLIPSPFIPISTQQSCPIQALKCPKFQIKKNNLFLDSDLEPPLHQPSSILLSIYCHCEAHFHKPLPRRHKRDIMKGDMKDNQNVFILTSDAHESCSQAPDTSHLISLQGQFHSLLDVCKLMFHMNLITLIKQITLERHLEQNKI